jgi:NAD-dependent SIR2 family protein deacetylase
MGTAIRYFLCQNNNCHNTVPFDLYEIKKPNSNVIKCPRCSKEWVTTITTACCSVTVRFVSVESGNKHPRTIFQSFIKPT